MGKSEFLILHGLSHKKIQNCTGQKCTEYEFVRAHNLCHDNQQLIVLAINCNHSARKNNCKQSGLIGIPA